MLDIELNTRFSFGYFVPGERRIRACVWVSVEGGLFDGVTRVPNTRLVFIYTTEPKELAERLDSKLKAWGYSDVIIVRAKLLPEDEGS